MDSGTEFLFGESVRSMFPPLSSPFTNTGVGNTRQATNPGYFPSAFRDVLQVCGFRLLMAPDWPLWEIRGDKVKPKMRTIHEYMNPIVERALRKNA